MAADACIAVFGGSGNTGREVIRVALAKGVRVRALYRPASQPANPPQGLEIVVGLPTDPDDVARTLRGTSSAILVFGPRLHRGVKPDVFCAVATQNVIAAMKALGMQRIVCQTGAMAAADNRNWSWGVRRFVRTYRRNFPEVNADRNAQEAAVVASGLDWLVAKPFRISGARAKGRVRALKDAHIGMFTSVRRADLAAFLIDEATNGRHHRVALNVVT